jgi:hypothetical protein
MNEKPILFSSGMVQAILEGCKTQTRRELKPQPVLSANGNYWTWKNCCWTNYSPRCPIGNLETPVDYCPYGQVGDRLWVRETFCDDCPSAREDENGVCYKANRENQPASDFCTKWKPSIFMPRWASRITLEITDIKVQRLQEINEKDAEAEGIGVGDTLVFSDSYKDSYAFLWNKINGKKHSWESNPFVWVIEFKRIV